MTRAEMAREALAVFDRVVQSGDGLRTREGQRLMAEQVACTFSEATWASRPKTTMALLRRWSQRAPLP